MNTHLDAKSNTELIALFYLTLNLLNDFLEWVINECIITTWKPYHQLYLAVSYSYTNWKSESEKKNTSKVLDFHHWEYLKNGYRLPNL